MHYPSSLKSYSVIAREAVALVRRGHLIVDAFCLVRLGVRGHCRPSKEREQEARQHG